MGVALLGFPQNKKIWSAELKIPNHVWGPRPFCLNLATWLLKIVETSFLAQNDRNGHIYISVMKQHMP